MSYEVAVGLYRDRGTAQDVRQRLIQQGVAEQDIEIRPLARDAVLPPEATPQIMFSFVDWIVGNDLTTRFGTYVRNGETAVGVRSRSEAQVTEVIETMRHYDPLHIERVVAAEGAPS